MYNKDEKGYPAYAGIDPVRDPDQRRHQRLPRIRGDRSIVVRISLLVLQATPHTRGSTSVGFSAFLRIRGYPAYAGIDPLQLWQLLLPFWLPRIRGDRPEKVVSSAIEPRATPHTRGSTRSSLYRLRQDDGYPAYAGIDLFQSMHRNVVQQLPRKRGEFSFHSNWLSFQGILLL